MRKGGEEGERDGATQSIKSHLEPGTFYMVETTACAQEPALLKCLEIGSSSNRPSHSSIDDTDARK